ncbi:MAG: hypothetical protein P4L16_05320 [Chlamydiales bacterium]|nr:hypothetical protein [Chlamydiales bacterium]
MKKWLLLTLFLFTIIQNNYASDELSPSSIPKGTEITLILPVNWTSSSQYNLVATIPGEFHPLQSLSDWGNKESTLIEFVPNDENGDNWSEIITLNKYIDKKISADSIVAYLKEKMLDLVKNGKILQENASKEDNYQKASFALSYDLDGKHEVINAVYYSGPYDAAGIQYTIRPKLGVSDQEVLEKTDAFLKEHTTITP